MNFRNSLFTIWTLLTITYGLSGQADNLDAALWLKAEKGLKADVDKPIVWEDQSEYGRHAKQGLTNGVVKRVAGWKGHPALEFDKAWLFYNSDFLVNSDYTIFVVEQRSSDKIGNFFMGGRIGSKNKNLVLGYEGPEQLRMAHFMNDMDAFVSKRSINHPLLSVFRFSQSEGRSIYRNLEKRVEKAAPRHKSPLESYQMAAIGGFPAYNFYYEGKIYEILMFDKALSDTERIQVSNYLINKYELDPPPQMVVLEKPKATTTYSAIDVQNLDKSPLSRKTWLSYQLRPVSSTDTLRSLTLFVDFEDEPAGELSTQELAKNLQRSDTLHNFFHKISRGKMSVDHEFHHQWKRMKKPITAYQIPGGHTGFNGLRTYVSDAMNLFPEIDFSRYKVVHVATPPNRGFKLSPTTYGVRTPNGNRVGIVGLGLDSHRAKYPHKILTHEYGHQLGLPDLYPYAGSTGPAPEYWAETAVGPYDIMADAYGGWTMLGFHQYRLKWLSKEHIDFVEAAGWQGTLSPIMQDRGTSMVLWTRAFDKNEKPLIYCVEQVNPPANRRDLKKAVIVYSIDFHIHGGAYPVWIHRNLNEEINEAPLLVGEKLDDPKLPFTVRVLQQSGDDFEVKITPRKQE